MGERLFYGPNLLKPAFVEIDGKKVYASNDLGTALSGFLIDATFLGSLPSYGIHSLQPVAAHQLTVAGQTEMHVLGKLEDVPMKICYDPAPERRNGAPGPETWFDVIAPQVFVVRSLPVPLHVSDGPVNRRAGWSSGGEPRHEAETYGAPYNSHPYWRSSVGIAPLFAGPTVGFVGTPRAKVFGMTPAQARAAITALILALLWQLLR